MMKQDMTTRYYLTRYYHQQVRAWVQVHSKMIPRCHHQLQVARWQWTKRTYYSTKMESIMHIW